MRPLLKHLIMPVYQTQTLLESLAGHTDDYLQMAITEWQMIPHNAFTQNPSPDSWSANQCIDHLNGYGRYYLPKMKEVMHKAISKGLASEPLFKPGWLGNHFTGMMLTQPDGKPVKKMKTLKAYTSPQPRESHLVVAEFIEQQEEMSSLLQMAKNVSLTKTKVPTSLSALISMSLGDTFLFIIAHNHRHIMQAERALGSSRSSSKKIKPFLLAEMGVLTGS